MKTKTTFATPDLNRNLDLTLNLPSKGEIKIKKKIKIKTLVATMVLAFLSWPVFSAKVSLESAPPVVIKTVPVAGATSVDPALTEIKVTFSKAMQDGTWSWSTWGEETFPEMVGQSKYLSDGRTCVLTVKLQPGKFYATWLNSDKFKNFKDASGRPAVPYLLTFRTAEAGGDTKSEGKVPVLGDLPLIGARLGSGGASAEFLPLLNEDQRAILAWTDRQFRSYFDARTFEGWSETERAGLETKLIDALKGPHTRDYFQAINTLGAMRSTKALAVLRAIAYERAERNNRDRWMAIRALGLSGDQTDVPELIHLVYHGNVNTRWWAQLSLVRITGQNFAKDWNAWGKWWNAQGGQPPYQPEIIRWWNGQAEPEKLAGSLEEGDRKFFESLSPKEQSQTKTEN